MRKYISDRWVIHQNNCVGIINTTHPMFSYIPAFGKLVIRQKHKPSTSFPIQVAQVRSHQICYPSHGSSPEKKTTKIDFSKPQGTQIITFNSKYFGKKTYKHARLKATEVRWTIKTTVATRGEKPISRKPQKDFLSTTQNFLSPSCNFLSKKSEVNNVIWSRS